MYLHNVAVWFCGCGSTHTSGDQVPTAKTRVQRTEACFPKKVTGPGRLSHMSTSWGISIESWFAYTKTKCAYMLWPSSFYVIGWPQHMPQEYHRKDQGDPGTRFQKKVTGPSRTSCMPHRGAFHHWNLVCLHEN
ncbi:hypothetical protein AVEN_130540-1 [Araneus ventricosus]|uniref:Uncharacterized protein n=1 Tax=Araneus ventricosus TaxID=182803 RepID=A0A4Y2J6Q9_ARAVE|nr:hypothetical protein AVEN_130540-1 [Araneus ventricosus]